MSTKFFSKSVAILLVATCILLLICSIVFALCDVKTDDTDFQWKEYVVNPGDTLWNIIPDNNEYDIRYLIKITKAHNHIGDTLYAYNAIEIPDI